MYVAPVKSLFHRIQHIFDENSVTPGWVVHKDMGHGTDQLTVLDNGTAAHECVK